jgi:uncharacterized protein
MTHTVIVPGVGGSEHAHWQSWLQRQLMSCSRVEQQDWHLPVLETWVEQFQRTLTAIDAPIQIVAHSFGCLTTLAALNQFPALQSKIKNVVLVAPANPRRFGPLGFAKNSPHDYWTQFCAMKITQPTHLLISENDPWLSLNDATALAKAWKIRPNNLGAVGHINVASGFGPFPQIYDFLLPQQEQQHINITDDNKYLFRFAI